MSLRRRLLLYLLVSAPLVWGVALWFATTHARVEVNELFDTELIRLARQVQATLGGRSSIPYAVPAVAGAAAGEADLEDLALAVWDKDGHLTLMDREGARFPYRPQASGFTEVVLAGEPWRLYYLQSFGGEWLVAAGQRLDERDEVVHELTKSQIVPWLLVLPVLLAAMAYAVRKALMPLDRLSRELAARTPEDLQPLPAERAPAELAPLLKSMNALFGRIEDTLARERRFTADAAHELRTPLAALRAQWDVVRRAGGTAERARAEASLSAGLARLERLVSQMLALSRVEGTTQARLGRQPIDWPALLEDALSDCLPLAERRCIDIECDWPEQDVEPLPLVGDADLLTVLVRNLVDNAVRYAPEGTRVRLRLGAHALTVENEGTALDPAVQAHLGERFYRPEGQTENGSGLGISIVQRIAALHGLTVDFTNLTAPAGGVRVTVAAGRASCAAVTPPSSASAAENVALRPTSPG